MLWTVGLGDGRDSGGVCNGRVHGALGWVHVSEGGEEAGGLTCRVAVVGIGVGLVVCVVILGAGDGGVGRAVVLHVERAIADLLWGVLLLIVVAGAELLRLDVRPLLLPLLAGQAAHGVLLGQPGVGGLGGRRTADAVTARVARLAARPVAGVGDRNSGVPVGREVLVELVDVERLHVGHDFAAEFPNVHIAEVNVGLPASFL